MEQNKYEILCRYKRQSWEHCDYADSEETRDYLLGEYRMAYGSDFSFKVITLKQEQI